LRALDEKDMKKLAKHLVKKAKKHNIAIAVGIDVGSKLKSKKRKNDKFKVFVICWTPVDKKDYYCWLQRSSKSKDYKNASDEEKEGYRESHTLPVQNGCVEILVCGELFNPIIRNAIIGRRNKIAAVIDLAHISAGLRLAGSMKILARNGITSLCSVHTNGRRCVKYRYDPPETRNSTRDVNDISSEGTPWVEMKIWEV
jgi:hypothetical protein